MVTIEHKSLESKWLDNFAGYIVTSNQDTLIKIDIGDSCIICYNILSRCRGNTAYFKKVLSHSNVPEVIMKYLLNCDLSDFEPQEIPATKMKSDIMHDQLSTSIQFIINYIFS